ncbi:response regulator [Lacinutrix sp. WUR7]|uniref:response regulator n=1 Tax=Lacinutrix sp. WUR7 TaxID=2653681 RepID=UPI00193D0497|nr:response regulator [Lacinutrix sp. WUR7]QRM88827.1 response regulator [Lacinutrix sp. WUR7]
MKQINSVCLIDDDPIFIFAIKRIFKTSNVCENFTVYNNGEDAISGLLQTIGAGKDIPDLILLDLNMPIMDGWQFLDEFVKLKMSENITLYIVSSSVDPVDFMKAKEYELIKDFLVKPITSETLMSLAKDLEPN